MNESKTKGNPDCGSATYWPFLEEALNLRLNESLHCWKHWKVSFASLENGKQEKPRFKNLTRKYTTRLSCALHDSQFIPSTETCLEMKADPRLLYQSVCAICNVITLQRSFFLYFSWNIDDITHLGSIALQLRSQKNYL